MLVQAIPYPAASAGPGGNIVFAVQSFETGTTTGIQTFTSPQLAGIIPKAVITIAPIRPVADVGESVTSGIGMGVIDDAGAGGGFDTGSQDNVATTFTRRQIDTGAVGYRATSATTVTNIKRATAICKTGGVELNFTANGAPNYRSSFIAFAGDDLFAKAGRHFLGTGTLAQNVATNGFMPDVVIMMGPSGTTSFTSGFGLSFGICSYEGGTYRQRAVLWSEAHNLADSRPFQTLSTTFAGGEVDPASGALSYGLTLGGFNSSGFTVTPSASSSNDHIPFVALNFGSRRHKIVDFTTPTTTGSSTISGAGFKPSFALVALTNQEATDTYANTTSNLQSGFGLCSVTADQQWGSSWRIAANVPMTDTAGFSGPFAVLGANATDCAAIRASFNGWTADGMGAIWEAVQATGKKGFILFVE